MNLKDCDFRVIESKLGTGRVVAWNEFDITNSFTFESSYYGVMRGEETLRPFSKQDYQKLGSDFVLSIYEFTILAKQLEKELI